MYGLGPVCMLYIYWTLTACTCAPVTFLNLLAAPLQGVGRCFGFECGYLLRGIVVLPTRCLISAYPQFQSRRRGCPRLLARISNSRRDQSGSVVFAHFCRF